MRVAAEPPRAADRRIRELRPPKPFVDPWKAHGSIVEKERAPNGELEDTLTIFLAGSECPFTCSFCDLWRYTTADPTPVGAIPRQIDDVLRSIEVARIARVKLYNASNFFEARAVPPEDLPRIAEITGSFGGVTVECHATLVGQRTVDFARRLHGRLEAAIGLETLHRTAIEHLNKRMDLSRFDFAAKFLGENGIDLRVFVLLGAPHIPAAEQVEWTVRTAAHASQVGARIVSIIPVRPGNGELERLARLGLFSPPTLSQLEEALDACIALPASDTVFTADLWNVDRLVACLECRDARIERLRRMNLNGRIEAPVRCESCG